MLRENIVERITSSEVAEFLKQIKVKPLTITV
jgi:hypothetical protein